MTNITLPLAVVQQALDALTLIQTDVEWELNSPTRKACRKAELEMRAALEQPHRDPFLKERQQLEQEWCDLRAMKAALEQPQADHTALLAEAREALLTGTHWLDRDATQVIAKIDVALGGKP